MFAVASLDGIYMGDAAGTVMTGFPDIPEAAGLYRMRETDIPLFARCCASAYSDYPVFKDVCPDGYDPKAVMNIMTTNLKATRNSMLCFSPDKDVRAIAQWMPPGRAGTVAEAFDESGGEDLKVSMYPGVVEKLNAMEDYCMELMDRYSDDRTWYLNNIAMYPEEQGKGRASVLMRPMLRYFDRVRCSCYLETHKERNVRIYEHYGFKVMEVGKIPGTDIAHYAMLREPQE